MLAFQKPLSKGYSVTGRPAWWLLGLCHWKGYFVFQTCMSDNLATWKYRNVSGVLWSEEPRHHSASGMMKRGLAGMFSLPVCLSPSYESYFCSFSYRCHLPLFRYGNGFHGGDNRTKDCALCISTYTIDGNAGIQGSREPRESSYWFPLINCWTLLAGLSPLEKPVLLHIYHWLWHPSVG